MFVPTTAHVGDAVAEFAGNGLAAVVAGCVAVYLLLAVEHRSVQFGGFRWRHLRIPAFVAVSVMAAGLVAPAIGIAQDESEPVGLPDLISDPPFIWYNTTTSHPTTGEQIRVMAFDGYIHNVGTGSLDVAGNPQVEGGMKQRVFNGTEWEVVGEPPVRFETEDGHNHFHLMEAVEYAMWTDDRTTRVSDAPKVGFCLIDVQVSEEEYDARYAITDSNYCGVDEPDRTELRMGITPGWIDVYEANLAFQWIDISNVQPGRYWVSAVMDPYDRIVESNEDNNELVFSRNSYDVDGYVARDLPTQSPGEIRLKANAYGLTGHIAFVLEDGPTNGTLNQPLGVDLYSDTIVYTPAPGFSGTDSFTYYAHDTTNLFPIEPHVVTVSIDVTEPISDQDSDPLSEAVDVNTADLSALTSFEWTLRERASVTVTAPEEVDGWYASGLPPGLTIDDQGSISGTPTVRGTYDVDVATVKDGVISRSTAQVVVVSDGLPPMIEPNDFASAQTWRLRYRLGRGIDDARFEAIGLPAGVVAVDNIPLITGTPEEAGTFDITLQAIVDDEVVDSVSFTWTVHPSTRPAFPL